MHSVSWWLTIYSEYVKAYINLVIYGDDVHSCERRNMFDLMYRFKSFGISDKKVFIQRQDENTTTVPRYSVYTVH